MPTGPPRALLLTRALLALLEKLGARTRRAGNDDAEKPRTGKTERWSHTVMMRRQIGRFCTTADENVIFYHGRRSTYAPKPRRKRGFF